MSLHDDLLEQARHLLARDPGRPKQASLRRAISAAYYALFHLLIDAAASRFKADPSVRLLIARAFVHGEMSKCSKSFGGGSLPTKFQAVGVVVGPRLRNVSQTFIDLQQARHEADYNLAKRFKRSEATEHVERVGRAFHDWRAIQKDKDANFYLASLLFWEKWDKVR